MPSPTPVLEAEDVEAYVRDRCAGDGGASKVGLELEWLTRPVAAPSRPATLGAVERIASTVYPLTAGGTVSFEPGGQLELSTQPFADLDSAIAAATADGGALRHAAAANGIELVASGIDPLRTPRRLLDTPRYRAMEQYFGADGQAGRRMMCTTAAIQVNVGIGPADQWCRRFRLAQAIGPLLVAAFANSPIAAGRSTGWFSTRMAVWGQIDRSRCAPVLVGDDLVQAWASYALDASVMLVRDGDDYVVVNRATALRDWIRDGHLLGYPTEDDLAYHLTTLFPPVRVKGWLELRMIDALPSPHWEAAATVVYALLTQCDHVAVAKAVAGTERMWTEAARYALEHPALAAAADRAFALAVDAAPPALQEAVLAYRARFVDRRRCPAHDQLASRREPAWI